MDLWADNIAVMNPWSGSTSVPLGLKLGAGTDPNNSIVNFHTIYATNGSGPIPNSSRAERI